MRRWSRVRVLSLLPLVAILPASLFAQVPASRRVADLASDESLRIRYFSTGCYHLQERLIVIAGGRDKSAAVSPASRESVGMPRDAGGNVRLDGFDVRRFDRLLAFYRAIDRPRGCVIKEDIILTWMKRGEPVAIERFADQSCAASENPGRLTLRELVLRAGNQLR